MFHLDKNLLARRNFTGTNTVFTALALGMFMYLPGYAVSQDMIQRYVCASTLARGPAVVLLSAVINVVLGLLFLLVGTALFAFYNQPGLSGLPTAGAELASEDQILPYFIATELSGVGLLGLILAGLFAAAMSTIDSGINGVTSVIIYDWLKGKALSIRISRTITAVLGMAVIAAALYVPVLGDTIIVIITAIASISLGMLLAIFLLGMLVRRANMGGMLVGLATGFSCLGYVWFFTNIPKWWFGAFTIVLTFAVGLMASFLFSPPREEALKDTMLSAKRS